MKDFFSLIYIVGAGCKKNAFFAEAAEKKLKNRYIFTMDYEIRRLELFKDLLYLPAQEPTEACTHPPENAEGERMTRFETQVDKRNLEPQLEHYLCNGIFCGQGIPSNIDGSVEVIIPEGISRQQLQQIPAGTYAFVQSEYPPHATSPQVLRENQLRAAEALWLECLWEEWETADTFVYLREIPHGNHTVFQLFRRIRSSLFRQS